MGVCAEGRGRKYLSCFRNPAASFGANYRKLFFFFLTRLLYERKWKDVIALLCNLRRCDATEGQIHGSGSSIIEF